MQITSEQIVDAIKFTKEQKGFENFCPPLDEQLLNISTKLYWRKDVSNGCKQAFLHCWTDITKF